MKTVKEYLDTLKSEIAGCDPATIQDALSDAEEHLRTALESMLKDNPKVLEEDVISQIIEKYGTPKEIAGVYKEYETKITLPFAKPEKSTQRSSTARFFRIYADPVAWGALLYLMISLITGTIYFSWTVMGISTSASLLLLLIGPPVAILFLASIRGLAFLEGRLVEALIGERMPRRARFVGEKTGWWKRVKALLVDRTTWTAIIYMLLKLPLGIIYFTVFTIFISFSIVGIIAPITTLILGFPIIMAGPVEIFSPVWLALLMMLVGILMFTLMLHFAKLLGRGHAKFAKIMLIADAKK
ncbi:sensor domain-containing protein [Candidatus Neomarinimicrobiota bacterium]